MIAATLMFSLALVGTVSDDAKPAVEQAAATGEVTPAQDKVKAEGLFDNLMERRYAFSMNDDLHPSVADSVLGFFLGGLLCGVAGPVWLGGLIAGNPPDGYWEEAFVTWLFYAVPVAGAYLLVGWIPWVGWAFSVVMCPISLALAFYMVPVNTINAWDRMAKKNGVRAKRKKGSHLDDALPREERLVLAPEAMAY